MQDIVNRVFALTDFKHTRDCLLALSAICRSFHDHRQLVDLVVRPVLLLLHFTIGTKLHHHRRDRIVDVVGCRPVAHTLGASRIVDLRPVFLHLDLDIQANLLPHFHQNLSGWGLVGVVVVKQTVWDRITLIIGLLEQIASEFRVELRWRPAFDKHVGSAEAFKLKTSRHNGLTSPERIHDCLTINRMGHGAAHQRIAQHFILCIENRRAMVPDS